MKVWLAAQVMHCVHRYAAEFCPLETGGILLGWRSGEDCVVTDMRGPGLRALHGRYHFLPDHEWQLAEIRRAFKGSNGDIDYIGDWHSHPDGIAAMSHQDQITLRKIAQRVNNPIMLILAGALSDTTWTAGCWKGTRHGSALWRRFEAQPQDLKLFEPSLSWPKPLLSLH